MFQNCQGLHNQFQFPRNLLCLESSQEDLQNLFLYHFNIIIPQLIIKLPGSVAPSLLNSNTTTPSIPILLCVGC